MTKRDGFPASLAQLICPHEGTGGYFLEVDAADICIVRLDIDYVEIRTTAGCHRLD